MRKKTSRRYFVAVHLLTVLFARIAGAQNLTQYVDPFIGTDCGGTFPGAALPFGMVQFGPDTTVHQSYGGSYHWPDSLIMDFSITHLSGAGCNNKGDIPFLPVTGPLPVSPGSGWTNYCSTFSHTNEAAAAGYYRAQMLKYNVNVELTATIRSGFARLTYPATNQARVLINASINNTGERNGTINVVGNNQLTGVFTAGGTCSNPTANYPIYYVVMFDRPFSGFGTWLDNAVSNGSTSVSGVRSGAYLTFDTTTNTVVQMKIAISYVSLANAQQSMAAENPGWDFNAVRTSADAAWSNVLKRAQVAGGATADLKKFYTALYHCFYTPNIASDLNGEYMGFDNVVHTAVGRKVYQNYSGWDVYRSWIQVVAMLAPEGEDIVKSLIADGQEGGAMPLWSDQNKDLKVMVGDPSTVMVSDAYAFGVRNFDTAAALTLMEQSANTSQTVRNGVTEWLTLHYSPGNASFTLEYATADFAIATFARALGDNAKYSNYLARAQYWKNNWNPAVGYIQPRNGDGTWAATPFSPTSTTGFVEGDSAVYTWMIPYNLNGLFNLMGGNAAVIPRLDYFFTELRGGGDSPYFNIGNEPCFSQAWLYNSAGQPWKSQAVVRRVINEQFNSAPCGYPGDDDLGSMSSYLFWAYLGMYPMVPGTDTMVVHGPYFTSATLSLANGQVVQINGPGAGPSGQYLQSFKVNGVATTKTWFNFSDIIGGGTLDFVMGGTANMNWGINAGDAPPSFDTALPAPPAAPNGLSASAGDSQASLSWNASSGAVSYNVKRATTSGGPYSIVAATSATSLVNTGLVNGTTYYYVVSAVNAGGEGANSAQVSVTPAGAPVPPPVPTGVSAIPSDRQVNLAWTASSGATSYNVKRSTTSGGPYATIASPTGNSYVNTNVVNGTTYYFVVSAVNAYGESANSTQVTATPSVGVVNGLVGSWTFDENTGGTAGDSSGNNNQGTLNNNPTWVSPGKVGIAALSFNAASRQAVTVPGSASLNPTGGITIAAWINAVDWSGNRRIAQKGNGDNQYRLLAENGVFKFHLNGVGTLTAALPATNAWIHIAATWNGATMAIYTNGVLQAGLTAAGTIATTADPLAIACKNLSGTSGDYFNGQLDDVRIYNRALSAAEISTVMGGGTTSSNTPPVLAPIGNETATIGTLLTFTATATDADVPAQALTFSLDAGAPSGATINATSGAFAWTPGAAGNYTATVRVTDSAGGTDFETIQISVAGAGLPSPWLTADIGTVSQVGSATYSNGVYTVIGAGGDIWNTSDNFRFVYQALTGDGEIRVRMSSVTGPSSWSKAGVMIRESLNANSANAMMLITPTTGNGFSFQRRTSTGGNSSQTLSGTLNAAPNNWVRLVRAGNSISGYKSVDGVTWTQVGTTTTITMAANIYIGIAVTAHNGTGAATAVVENVAVVP